MSPVTISGGTFSFLNPTYDTPPTWQGYYYIFPWLSSPIRQVYIDNDYIYSANEQGMDVFDISTELFSASITTTSGYTTIAGDSGTIYLGTTSSGVKKVNKTCVSGSVTSPYDITACVIDYLTLPYIESNNIDYLHASEGYLGLVMASGTIVAGVKNEPQGYYSSITLSGSQTTNKCHITSAGHIYYIVIASGAEAMVAKANTVFSWLQPSKTYVAGGSILASGIVPRDIYVTEGTATNGLDNTLFISTTSGAYVIDEFSEDYAVYYTS